MPDDNVTIPINFIKQFIPYILVFFAGSGGGWFGRDLSSDASQRNIDHQNLITRDDLLSKMDFEHDQLATKQDVEDIIYLVCKIAKTEELQDRLCDKSSRER